MTSPENNEISNYETQSPQHYSDLDPLSCLLSYNGDIEIIIGIYEKEGNRMKGNDYSCQIICCYSG